MNRLKARAATALVAANVLVGGCGGSSLDVIVMQLGPSFPARPETCQIDFRQEDATTLNVNYHLIAQIQVAGVDSEGRVLSDEISPEIRDVLRPAACKIGADSVVAATAESVVAWDGEKSVTPGGIETGSAKAGGSMRGLAVSALGRVYAVEEGRLAAFASTALGEPVETNSVGGDGGLVLIER